MRLLGVLIDRHVQIDALVKVIEAEKESSGDKKKKDVGQESRPSHVMLGED